jgi:hypothetical protein
MVNATINQQADEIMETSSLKEVRPTTVPELSSRRLEKLQEVVKFNGESEENSSRKPST